MKKQYSIGEPFQYYEAFPKENYLSIPNRILSSTLLNSTEKIVLSFLISISRTSNKCYPKQSLISEAIGMSNTNTSLTIKALQEKKLISIQIPTGKNRLLHHNNTYNVLWHEIYEKTLSTDIKSFNARETKALMPNIINKLYSESSKEDSSLITAVSKETAESAVAHSALQIKRKLRCRIEKESLQKQIVPLPRTSPPIEAIMEYWTELELQKHPAIETKSYKEGIKKIRNLLRGRYFGKKYSVEEIKDAIHRFSLAATDEQYEPSNQEIKKRMRTTNIGKFILNEFGTNGSHSYFRTYFENPPKHTKEIIESKNKALTERLKKKYIQQSTGSIRPMKFSIGDENCFALATNKLLDWVEHNRNKINMYLFSDSDGLYGGLINMMIETLDNEMHGDWSKITPAWLASARMFDWRLPSYLNKQAGIKEERQTYSHGFVIDNSEDVRIELCDEE